MSKKMAIKTLEQKQAAFEVRQKEFGASIKPFLSEFHREMLLEFYFYWSEPNKSKTKMKFELEDTWDIKRRLLRWERNNTKWKTHGTNGNQTGSGTSANRVQAARNF